MVRAATAQAVMASISTPVLPSQRTIDRTSIAPPSASMSNVTSTDSSASGCARGMSDGVCFAARTPAILAVVRTSPFGSARSMSFLSVAGVMRTVAAATASRCVGFFAPTCTMEMPPVSSRCEKSLGTFPLLRRIDVQERLAGKPRAQLGLGDDLRFGSAAQIERTAGDALLDTRQPRRIPDGAERLRTTVPLGQALVVAEECEDLGGDQRIVDGEEERLSLCIVQRANDAE